MLNQMLLDVARDGTAWKTATMRGYLFKTVLDADTYGAGAYKLTFRKAANDTSGSTPVPVDYDFYFNVDATKSATAASATDASTLLLDKELLLHVLNAQWASGKATDFELVRAGPGSW